MTADFSASLETSRLTLQLRNRLLTSERDLDRTDFITLGAEYLVTSKLALRLGIATSGNYGGVELQEGWHRAIRVGRTRDRSQWDGLRKAFAPLQKRYPRERRVGAELGMRFRHMFEGGGKIRLSAEVESQLSVGRTGVSFLRGGFGIVTEQPLARCATLKISALGLLGVYGTVDETVALPGGYERGVAPSFTLGAALNVAGVELFATEEIGRDGSQNNGGTVGLSVPLP